MMNDKKYQSLLDCNLMFNCQEIVIIKQKYSLMTLYFRSVVENQHERSFDPYNKLFI